MTDLELIERQLENLKARLKRNPLTKEQSEPNYKYKQSDLNYREHEYLSNMIIQLESIKAKLEAWEIIKPNIQEETQLCESILGTYYRNTLVFKRRGYDSCENKTEYNTLLKALEVNDD